MPDWRIGYTAQPSSTYAQKENRYGYTQEQVAAILDAINPKYTADSFRKLLHDVGGAIGANRDTPQAGLLDLAAMAPVLKSVIPLMVATRHARGLRQLIKNALEYDMPAAGTRQMEYAKKIGGQWFEQKSLGHPGKFAENWDKAIKAGMRGDVNEARFRRAMASQSVKDMTYNDIWREYVNDNFDDIAYHLDENEVRGFLSLLPKGFREEAEKSINSGIRANWRNLPADLTGGGSIF